MRKKFKHQQELDFYPELETEKSRRYHVYNQILLHNPQIAGLALEDLNRGLKNPDTGCEGISAEQVVRILIVKKVEDCSYKKLPEEISDSIPLRRFCQYENSKVPCSSSMQEHIGRLRSDTMRKIHKIVIKYASLKKIEKGRAIRLDSTAVETDIHYPTDSSLIWDCVRKANSLAKLAKEMIFGDNYYFPNRSRIVKKLNCKVSNLKGKGAANKRKKMLKSLIGYGREVKDNTQKLLDDIRAEKPETFEQKLAKKELVSELSEFLGWFENVLLQAEERIIRGLEVCADDKVFSIFETHTDIIEKGSREPVFGHKISLVGGKSNLILDCFIHQGNPNDSQIFKSALDSQLEIYGKPPLKVATDGGFYSKPNLEYARDLKVRDVVLDRGFNKLNGYVKSAWVYKQLRRFRSGIEATISWSKRCFGLDRCNWKGWESFKKYIWSSVIAFNFNVIAHHLM